MEDQFILFHGCDSFNKAKGIFKAVTKNTLNALRERCKSCISCKKITKIHCDECKNILKIPEAVISCLVRTRTHIRKREINKRNKVKVSVVASNPKNKTVSEPKKTCNVIQEKNKKLLRKYKP